MQARSKRSKSTTTQAAPTPTPTPTPTPATADALPPVFIGIDWADKAHAVCLIDPTRPQAQPLHSTLEQQSEAIAAWASALQQKYPQRELCLIIEQSRGALITALLEVGGFTIYPINPKQAARFREALHPTGGKNDPADAELLATFLQHHRGSLRPLAPQSPLTRQLAELTQRRRDLVEDRKRVTLQLKANLKNYFPLILELFQDQLDTPLVTKLLKRWPSLLELKRAKPAHVDLFLKEHGVRNDERREALVTRIRAAVDLTRDKHLITPLAMHTQCLAQLIEVYVRSIDEFEQTIEQVAQQHEDFAIFKSLPGAGAALVPRLIVAFGSDRDRYQSATELQNQSGIAPITKQSGQSQVVHSRRACPKFMKQTFHEFADHSRRWCDWAKAFYDLKRAAGLKHHAAIRALAYKWIRILFHMWKHHQPYDNHRYTQSLTNSHSPVAQRLENAKTTKNAKNVT